MKRLGYLLVVGLALTAMWAVFPKPQLDSEFPPDSASGLPTAGSLALVLPLAPTSEHDVRPVSIDAAHPTEERLAQERAEASSAQARPAEESSSDKGTSKPTLAGAATPGKGSGLTGPPRRRDQAFRPHFSDRHLPTRALVGASVAPVVSLADLANQVESDTWSSETPMVEVATEEDPELTETPPVAALSGRVVDAPTGAPLSGATVTLHSVFYAPHLSYDHYVVEVGRVTTSDDGRYSFAPIHMDTVHFGPTGKVYLTASAPQRRSRVAMRLDMLQAELDVELPDLPLEHGGATLSGRVVNQHGQPAEGLVLTYLPQDFDPYRFPKAQRQLLLLAFPHGATDAEGRYQIEDLPLGRGRITVHAGIDGILLRVVRLDEPRVYSKDYSVKVGGAVSGVVVDTRGQPVTAALVRGGGNLTRSRADGTFLLENIRPGVFDMEVSHHLFRTEKTPGVEDGLSHIRVVLYDRRRQVSFFLTADGTTPVPRAQFVYSGQSYDPAQVPASLNRAAVDGVYAEELLPPMELLTISAEGFEDFEIQLGGLTDGSTFPVVLTPLPN